MVPVLDPFLDITSALQGIKTCLPPMMASSGRWLPGICGQTSRVLAYKIATRLRSDPFDRGTMGTRDDDEVLQGLFLGILRVVAWHVSQFP